jgi:uroporphyrinogen-III synthase
MADLGDRVIAFLEARRAAELGGLIARHHGVPFSAPCLRELHRPDAPEMAAAVDLLCGDKSDVVIFLTGVGASTIFDAAALHGREPELLAALARKRVAVRGPKPTAVLRKRGVRIDLTAPPPHTTQELLAALGAWDLDGTGVTVQRYGGPLPEFSGALAARGARVTEISPYVWDRPVDAEPILRLMDALDAGQIDALAGTSASQVENLFAIAREHRREAALRHSLGRVLVAAQGPVCAAAFTRAGVPVAVTPEHGHMGGLVLAIAHAFTITADRGRMEPIGSQR